MGINSTRVKKALTQRLLETVSGFKYAHELVEATLLQPEENAIPMNTEDITGPASTNEIATFPSQDPSPTQTHFVPSQPQVPTLESQSHSSNAEPNNLTADCSTTLAFGAACNQKPSSDLGHTLNLTNRICTSAPGTLESNDQIGSGGVDILQVQPTAIQQVVKDKKLVETSVDLEMENRRLKDQRTCKICMDREIGVVFLPCGHLISCVQCAPALKDCPLCRQPIHGTVKTYMS